MVMAVGEEAGIRGSNYIMISQEHKMCAEGEFGVKKRSIKTEQLAAILKTGVTCLRSRAGGS